MNIREFESIIEEMSPLSLQEEWDNSGWQILLCGREEQIERALVAMEITSEVIDEATRRGADLIVTHHPLIFGSLKQVSRNDVTGNFISNLIAAGISVYSSHTPFDRCRGGNNDHLAGLLRLLDIRSMETDLSGYCRVGSVDGECSIGEYIEQVGRWLGIKKSMMSFIGDISLTASKVGLCTGAGSQFIHAAKEAGCDLFITGDVKYHTARLAREIGLNVLDIGHYGSEKIFTENMASYLKKNSDAEIITSLEELDPFTAI